MKPHLRFISMAAVLVCAALACGIDENVVPSGGVLFQDDFSNTSSGWDKQRSTSEGMTDYENGQYRIQVLTAKTRVWANPHLSFTDVYIDADAVRQGGPEDNDFGVICRYRDEDNFYYMVIASDGYYGIVKVKDGDATLLGSERMGSSESIQSGNTSNHIRAECVGSTLTLYVNGQKLDSQQDAEFASGDVGLIASTYEEIGTDVLFDNFTVTKP
jgi:hypothetical protein